jgi:hypothetical protein
VEPGAGTKSVAFVKGGEAVALFDTGAVMFGAAVREVAVVDVTADGC